MVFFPQSVSSFPFLEGHQSDGYVAHEGDGPAALTWRNWQLGFIFFYFTAHRPDVLCLSTAGKGQISGGLRIYLFIYVGYHAVEWKIDSVNLLRPHIVRGSRTPSLLYGFCSYWSHALCHWSTSSPLSSQEERHICPEATGLLARSYTIAFQYFFN